jgi:protein-S-isoprenylcysteine O-methyltransferase Ste14
MFRFKGIEKLREKLPDYQGKKIFLFVLLVIVTVACSIMFQLFFDSISRLFPGVLVLQFLEPVTPILGSVIVLVLGFLNVYTVWRNRDKYKTKYKEKAYQKALKFGAVGVTLVISVLVHSIMPLDFLSPYTQNSNISVFLSTAINELIFGFSSIFLVVRIALSLFFLLLGFLTVYRAITVFGIDYMALVYLYYPEESEIQDSEIYSVLRHPTYHTLLLFYTSSLFLRFSFYSLAYFFIFLVGIKAHLKFVEEKELIQRFGEGYINYRKEVPALLVRFRDLGKYFRYLFSRNNFE